MRHMLYFAYGSNLSSRRLRARVPSACFIDVATLGSHALCFHKAGRDGSAKCDALFTGDPADRVIGVVFRIASAHRPALDRAEGLGTGYESKVVPLLTAAGERIEAFTYYATAIEQGLQPYAWYLEHVLRGCREHALPEEYVARIAGVDAIEDPDPDRARSELSIHR